MSHSGLDTKSTTEPKGRIVPQARTSVEGWKKLTYVPGCESEGNSRRSINLDVVLENVKNLLPEAPASDPASTPTPPYLDPSVRSLLRENGSS